VYYYVHSYAAPYNPGVLESDGWSVATATYGEEEFNLVLWERLELIAVQECVYGP
jgi:imidazoleglycerol phosphate synthase glutamine amidotransferase subunit HisH